MSDQLLADKTFITAELLISLWHKELQPPPEPVPRIGPQALLISRFLRSASALTTTMAGNGLHRFLAYDCAGATLDPLRDRDVVIDCDCPRELSAAMLAERLNAARHARA